MDTTEAKEGTAMNTTSTKRTTIVNHPDGTQSKRTSKTRTYQYAVVRETTAEQRAIFAEREIPHYTTQRDALQTCVGGVAVAFVNRNWGSASRPDAQIDIHMFPAGYDGDTIVETPGGTGGNLASQRDGGEAIFNAHAAKHGHSVWVTTIYTNDTDLDADQIVASVADSDPEACLAKRIAWNVERINKGEAEAAGHRSNGVNEYGVVRWSSRMDLAMSYCDSNAFWTEYVVECEEK